MFEWAWLVLTWAEVAFLVAYCLLFLARRDVRLDTRTLARILSLGLIASVGTLVTEWPEHSSIALVILICRFHLVLLLLGARGKYLVHARADAIGAEIDEACRRLFLAKEEPRPGTLLLSARGTRVAVRLMSFGPLTLILFTRPTGANKLTLFFDWLAKRHPGPIPRVRVDFSRR